VTIRITPLDDPDRPGWLATDRDGTPSGYAFLRTAGDLEVHVHPAERRRGVGSALLGAVAALAPDATIAGFSELVVPGDGTGDGRHYGTGVLPGHRGRGLARQMKAETIRLVRARFPELSGLVTDTADSNTAMRRINDGLGYAPTHRSPMYQLDMR
jgi:GNAT superfamily N-acetyltransferase